MQLPDNSTKNRPFSISDKRQFVSLETYRRDGTAVRTPLLFIIHRNRLYMRTAAHTYKVKRIQNNPHVRVAPSTFKGRPLGKWLEGQAKIYNAADMHWVNALSKHRNGWFKRLIDLRSRFKDVQFVVIEVRFD
jgi:PPOX class probable F420-dependent enzyme